MQGAISNDYRQAGFGYMSYAKMQQPKSSSGMPPTKTVNPADSSGSGKAIDNNLNDKYQCRTCEDRTYMDGSNDPGVSMKTPTKIDPNGAAAAVMAHEREHVTRNAFKAQAEGREVISSSVTIHMGVCSECGKSYVAGGTTRTVTAGKDRGNAQQSDDNRVGARFSARA